MKPYDGLMMRSTASDGAVWRLEIDPADNTGSGVWRWTLCRRALDDDTYRLVGEGRTG